ncbi:uncharacterized protein LOC107048249 [Diachasma alloeum]|uniref:uncharacterized protein LOC107048249 n=1 Tax=Diachasma alloeum TaxID=454923 RepID=UPI0007381FAA|nr:uncharacterized protein LOC107048249 [Diachasma alloeum]
MFETGRRSAISSSELGLYSDRADRYHSNKYGSVVKKFVIVVMTIVAVILAAIFIYDFASGTSATSKVSQETKHIYILQNALKKSSNLSKKITTTSQKPEVERLTMANIEDRYDDDIRTLSFVDAAKSGKKGTSLDSDPIEPRAQSLENFKLRKRLLESAENEDVGEEEVESKQLFSNHAVVYRVRQMYPHGLNDDEEPPEESRPTPFHFQLQNPTPSSFQRPKFPQLSQYRYPHSSRNIQDIIKYLTNDPESSKRGIKFTGVYMNPKKYDLYPDIGEMMANSDKSEIAVTEEEAEDSESSPFLFMNNDPFYPYKPKHPADVNLLAPANLRFSPAGLQRYNPYYESYMQRPLMMRPPPPIESSYDSGASYAGAYGNKKRKAKPFSVMLDIYPITELNDQPTNKKLSRPRPVASAEDYSSDPRIPLTFGRGGRYYGGQSQPIPVVAIPASQSGMSEEEEKQQMVFHLNLYPRKKNKLSRKDILQGSEAMRPEDQEQFVRKVMSPFDAITKQLADHSVIEGLKEEGEESDSTNSPLTKYEESFLEMPNEDNKKVDEVPLNHKDDNTEENVETTSEAYQIVENETKNPVSSLDIDTPEGFQKFADGLVATD